MDLPDEAVKEFQRIYKNKIGEEISLEKAKIKAVKFLKLFDLITKPVKN